MLIYESLKRLLLTDIQWLIYGEAKKTHYFRSLVFQIEVLVVLALILGSEIFFKSWSFLPKLFIL